MKILKTVTLVRFQSCTDIRTPYCRLVFAFWTCQSGAGQKGKVVETALYV